MNWSTRLTDIPGINKSRGVTMRPEYALAVLGLTPVKDARRLAQTASIIYLYQRPVNKRFLAVRCL